MVNIIKTAPSKGTPWWCPTCQLWLSGGYVTPFRLHDERVGGCGGQCDRHKYQEKVAEDSKSEIERLREEVKKWQALAESQQVMIEIYQRTSFGDIKQ